jgi:hypothetical protein
MAFEVEITNASDVLAVTDEIGRQLRNGKIPSVTIKVPRDQKTANQRGYFFGGIIATALRHEIFESVTQDELVDAIIELESTEHIDIGGKITIARHKRISARDSEEMSHLIDFALHWLLSEFGIYIDTPEEYYARQWKNKS